MRNKPIIVLVTRGKHDVVHFAHVRLFDTFKSANECIEEMADTVKQKHWTKAEIVDDFHEVELTNNYS